MRIFKSLGIIFLLLIVGLTLVVLSGRGSSGNQGGIDNIIDIIGGKPDSDDIEEETGVPDISSKTHVVNLDYNFSGNEVTGYKWTQYNMQNVFLKRADNLTTYDGVLDKTQDSIVYTVPNTTNRLVDMITFPSISYSDYSRYFAYDFTLSSSSEYPCGLTFALINTDSSTYETIRGEKLFIMRQNGQDILFKERVLATYEDKYTTEYDEDGNPYDVITSEPVYKVDTVTLGSLRPNKEYHFTFIIDCDRSTYDVLDPGSSGLIKASYAYVYLNGQFFTTLGFNINELSQDGQGADIEYALGIEFDTKYKTCNAGSNFTMSNFIHAGTKALDYIYDSYFDNALDNYYVADIFNKSNYLISLYKNPDWYYSTCDPILSDPGKSTQQNVNLLHLTQVEDEYRFKDETIRCDQDVLDIPFITNGSGSYIEFENNSLNVSTTKYFLLTFDVGFESMVDSDVEMFFANDEDYSTRSPLLTFKSGSDDRIYLYITKNGVEKCYGYLRLYDYIKITFAVEKDGVSHIYINGRWLTSVSNFFKSSDYGDHVDYFYFRSSSDSLSDVFYVETPKYQVLSDTCMSENDTFVEYIFKQPMAYLYYNADFVYYNLTSN